MPIDSVEYPKIVLFGASIIQYSFENNGLSSQLANAYQRKLDIVTKGFEGYNSRWALPLAEPVFDSISKKFEAVIIFIGTNDASNPGTPMALSEEEYLANMSEITKIAQKYTDTVLLVGTGLINELAPNKGAQMRSNARALKYNRLLRDVAKEHDAVFIDLWTEFRTYNGEAGIMPGNAQLSGEKGYAGPKKVEHLVHDGIHFTAQGYQIFYDAVQKGLKSRGKGPESYESVIPSWVKVYKAQKIKSKL